MLIPEQLYGLSNIDGKPTETRVADAESARRLVNIVIQEDQPRSRQRALVKGMLDGNPPYSDSKRRNAGLGWTANLNFMEGEAIVSAAQTPYYHLFSGAETYVTVNTAFMPDHPDHQRWNDTISDRFTCMLDRWPEFDFHMAQHQYWMLVEGYAPVLNGLNGDWRFTSLPSNALLAPKGAAACLDDRIPFIVVRQQYRTHELYRKIASKTEGSGWNEKAVQYAIKNATATGNRPNTTEQPWEWWQRQFKNNDLYLSFTDCDVVRCAHVFVKELNGGITHLIVTENGTGGSGEEGSFLYRSVNRFKSYKEALIVFFQNIGDGTWHSVRGIAMKAFKHLEASNRLKCRVLDGAFMESGLVLQAGTQTDQERMQVMQLGPVTYIPAGTDVKQTKLAGFLDGAMAADRMLTNHLQGNLGQFRTTMSREDGRGEVPTAEQIRAQVNKEASLSQGQITLYYLTLDKLYDETLRRAIKSDDSEAELFRQQCYDRGVPPEALNDLEYIRANRMSGYGSNQMRQQANQQMMEVLPMLPEDGKNNFLDDYITGVQGPDKVMRYNPRVQEPTSDDAWAVMENAAIKGGEQPLLVSGQSDVKHLQIHIKDAKETLAPLQQSVEQEQADPGAIQQGVEYIEIMAPHCEQHLQRIANDKSRQQLFKMFQLELRNIVAFHGKLRRALIVAQNEARQAAMEEQNAHALGAMDEAKLASMQADTQRKDAKAQHDMQLKTVKTMNSERLKTWEAQVSNQRETLKTASDIRLNRIKTASQKKAA